MILIPNKGRDERNNGSKAQCIAQAAEAVIPKKSQFIFDFMRTANVQKKQHCCKTIVTIKMLKSK